jgi:hypothetical protein
MRELVRRERELQRARIRGTRLAVERYELQADEQRR